jgi:hypothetical protein
MTKIKLLKKSKIAWSSAILLMIGLEPYLPQLAEALPDSATNALKILIPIAVIYWRTTTTGATSEQNKTNPND